MTGQNQAYADANRPELPEVIVLRRNLWYNPGKELFNQ